MKASTLSSTNNLTIFPIVVLLSHPESNDTKLATQSHTNVTNAFCLVFVFLIVHIQFVFCQTFFSKRISHPSHLVQ